MIIFINMNTISISQLKTNPNKAIISAFDYPLAVQVRNKTKAYLLGNELYEKIVAYLEDYLDKAVIRKTDFTKGRDFEKVAEELGL